MFNCFFLEGKCNIKEVKELEQIYINRKDEVNTMSKFYTGDKLTWRERIQALVKGRIYVGSLKLKEKEDKSNGKI